MAGADDFALEVELIAQRDAQSIRKHDRLHPALHRLRQHHRVAGAEPADGRPAAAQGADRPGSLSGWYDRADAWHHDGHWYTDL